MKKSKYSAKSVKLSSSCSQWWGSSLPIINMKAIEKPHEISFCHIIIAVVDKSKRKRAFHTRVIAQAALSLHDANSSPTSQVQFRIDATKYGQDRGMIEGAYYLSERAS